MIKVAEFENGKSLMLGDDCDLRMDFVSNIVCCMSEAYDNFYLPEIIRGVMKSDGITECVINLKDIKHNAHWEKEDLRKYSYAIKEALKLIYNSFNNGITNDVLVCCSQGRSRSVGIVCLYLEMIGYIKGKTAYELIKEFEKMTGYKTDVGDGVYLLMEYYIKHKGEF